MRAFLDRLDGRTGYRQLLHLALYENIPGGARWRYVWGSTLIFALSLQFITGIFLWMCYSPSSQSAWESVYFIQHQIAGGWFLRGLHHYTAHTVTFLLILHLMQVVIDGAYRAPREVNFWFGLGLLGLVMGLSLTGYLLPWDQRGYWATKVATSLMAVAPLLGATLQQLVVGGAEYGHHTLTRFFAIHAGLLPGLIVLLVAGHIYLFRRHGVTVREPKRGPDSRFWPDQVLKDTVACLAVLAVVLFLVIYNHGADLGAPADPSEEFSAARPDWYFLFLFQFLKYFPGRWEVWGAIVIPGLAVLAVAAMPILGRWRLGHRFNLGFLGVVLVGAGLLTGLALVEDFRNADYQAAVQRARWEAERAVALAQSPWGIPLSGAAAMLRADPLAQGPKLFARNCSSCHRFDGHDGLGHRPTTLYLVATNQALKEIAAATATTEEEIRALSKLRAGEPAAGESVRVYDRPTASDLKGFASREWLSGLLDPERVASLHYFGGTKFKEGRMVKFVRRTVAEYSPEQREALRKVILALSAEAALPAQRQADAQESAAIAEGRKLLAGDVACTECHRFHSQDEDTIGPDLTGYGSRAWLAEFLSDPAHERFYAGRNDRMPSFGKDRLLSPEEIGLVAEWLRGSWYEPGEDEEVTSTAAGLAREPNGQSQ